MEWLCFVLIAITPIFLSIVLNQENGTIEDLKYFAKVIWKTLIFLIWIFFVRMLLLGVQADFHFQMEISFFKILYFAIMIAWILIINYFSTRCLEFRECIKKYSEQFIKFIDSNFILNLVFMLLLVFLPDNLIEGLIGSYAFFALTTI